MSERSHGQMRPSLPRSSDLAVPQAAPDPRQGRDDRGRFAPGNASGRGRGWKRAIARLAGRDLAPEHHRLAGDAASLYRAVLSELPHGGPLVSPLVAEHSRCSVLSPRFAERALELGLDSDEGRAALEMSMKLGQRAERLAISALDLSTRLAAAHRSKGKRGLSFLLSGDDEPTPRHAPALSAPEAGSGGTDEGNASGGHPGASGEGDGEP